MERGDAFKLLWKKLKKHASLEEVDRALDQGIPHKDINRDGRQWYLHDDLKDFAERFKIENK